MICFVLGVNIYLAKIFGFYYWFAITSMLEWLWSGEKCFMQPHWKTTDAIIEESSTADIAIEVDKENGNELSPLVKARKLHPPRATDIISNAEYKIQNFWRSTGFAERGREGMVGK